jgi:hypothetical protein
VSDPAPYGSLICDDYASRCDCCGRLVTYVRGSMWHGESRIACFHVWYGTGLVEPAEIKAYVLAAEAAATWPF